MEVVDVQYKTVWTHNPQNVSYVIVNSYFEMVWWTNLIYKPDDYILSVSLYITFQFISAKPSAVTIWKQTNKPLKYLKFAV